MTSMSAAAACAYACSSLLFTFFLRRPRFSDSMVPYSGVSSFLGFRKALTRAVGVALVSAVGTGVVSAAAAAATTSVNASHGFSLGSTVGEERAGMEIVLLVGGPQGKPRGGLCACPDATQTRLKFGLEMGPRG